MEITGTAARTAAMTNFLLHKRRWFELDDRRAQERSIPIAPIALYSATMNTLEADRPSLSGLLRAAGAVSAADLPPLSPSYSPVLGRADGLKMHSDAPLGWRLMRRSLVATGRPGLLAGLVQTVMGRAQAVGGALAWGRASFNKVYPQSGSAPLPRETRRCTVVLTWMSLVPDCGYTPYLLCASYTVH